MLTQTICREPILEGEGALTHKRATTATTLIESVTVRQSLTSPLARIARPLLPRPPLALNGRDEMDGSSVAAWTKRK